LHQLGLEPKRNLAKTAEKLHISPEVWDQLENDPDFIVVIQAWPTLTPQLRRALSAMAAAASSKAQTREDHGKRPGGNWHKQQ